MYHNFLIHSSTNGHLTTLSLWSLDRPWTPSISFCTPCFSAPWFLVFRTCLTPCPRAFAHAVEIVAQVCLNFCDSMDPAGSSVHGILQARILAWFAMPSSRDLSNPGIEPVSLTSPVLARGFFSSCPAREGQLDVVVQPLSHVHLQHARPPCPSPSPE